MNSYKKKFSFATLIAFILGISIAVFILGIHAKAKDKAAQANQVFIDYNYLVSFVNLYNGKTEAAIRDYRKILPYLKTAKIYNEYANILLYARRYKEAENFLTKAIKIFPNDKRLYQNLLNVFILRNEDKKAINLIKNNKKIFRNSSDTYKRLGLIYMENGNCPKAIEFFKKAKDYDKDKRIITYIANCYKASGKIDKAIEYAQKLVQMEKNNVSHKMFLANLYEQAKQYQKAIEIYKTINIDKDEKLSAIGNDYYLLGKLEKAFVYFKRAYMTKPKISYAEKAIYMLMRLGRYKDVINFVKEESVPLTTDRMKYFYGVSLMSEKDYKDAIDIFSKISPASILYKDALYNEVVCYTKLNQKDKAINVLKSVKNKDKDIYYMLADLYLKYKDYKMSINTVKNNINAFKDKAKAYFYIADIYYDKLKNREKGIEYLKKSLSINPDNPIVLNYLGYLYIDENINIDKGIELVKKALKKDPNNPYYLDSLGWGYYKKGNYKEALSLLKKALQNKKSIDNLDDSVIEMHISKVYLKLGEKEKAKKILENLVKRFPKNIKAKKLLNSIK